MEYYELKILGLTRMLPILKAPIGINIAGFNIVGDMELTKRAAKEMSDYIVKNKLQCDYLLTTELKGVPIAQEVARNLNIDYVCLRKAKKCYMPNPVSITSESITSGQSEYYISETDLNKLANKNVFFVDDVFSTGATFTHILDFAKKYNIHMQGALFILREGIAPEDNILEFNYSNVNIKCCEFLPLPKN